MRIALMASGYVGGRALEIMLQRDHAPNLVVFDGPLGGMRVQLNDLMRRRGMLDRALDAAELEPGEVTRRFKENAIELGVLAWWPRVIKNPLLSAPARGFLNFHPSLLPYNRGKHTTFWNLVEDVPFGVSIHWADHGVDSGPIAFSRRIEKSWEDNSETLYLRARSEILKLFDDHLEYIVSGEIPRIVQDVDTSGRARQAREITAAARIDLDQTYSARELFNLVRAKQFPPHSPAYFDDAGESFDVRVSITRRSQSE